MPESAREQGDSRRRVSFWVLAEPEDGEVGVLVTGKCLEGPLRVGDVLTLAEAEGHGRPDGGAVDTDVIADVLEVSPWPDRLSAELPAGYNGRLLLTGSNLSRIGLDARLVDLPSPTSAPRAS